MADSGTTTRVLTWLKTLRRSRVVRNLNIIGEDTLIALFLLMALTVVHGFLLRIDASVTFKQFFSTLHECMGCGSYLVVSVRGLFRLATS